MIKEHTIDSRLHVSYDTTEGVLLIDTDGGIFYLDIDEAVTLAEKLKDWLLSED